MDFALVSQPLEWLKDYPKSHKIQQKLKHLFINFIVVFGNSIIYIFISIYQWLKQAADSGIYALRPKVFAYFVFICF